MLKISEEIVPLSRRQAIVLLVTIACIFQFTLFYTPALAAEAVSPALINASIIANSTPTTTNLTLIDLNPNLEQLAALTSLEIINLSPKQDNQQPKYKVVRTSTHVITAYNSEPGQTDNSPCITANGYNVCQSDAEDTIAANFLKFGTKVQIPELFGDQVFVVRDRMNKRHATRVDVWMQDHHEAIEFGVKTARIQVVEEIN